MAASRLISPSSSTSKTNKYTRVMPQSAACQPSQTNTQQPPGLITHVIPITHSLVHCAYPFVSFEHLFPQETVPHYSEYSQLAWLSVRLLSTAPVLRHPDQTVLVVDNKVDLDLRVDPFDMGVRAVFSAVWWEA
uniref:Uncharacterized protein n=1 Tax=Electrophorus electricus TaxID=8005 RepID=A0AAY5ER41_ELEEL